MRENTVNLRSSLIFVCASICIQCGSNIYSYKADLNIL